MRDRVRPPKDLEQVLDDLKDARIFDTKQKGMMFAASVGYCLHRDEVDAVVVDSHGEGIRLEYFDSQDDVGFIDALAVATTKDLSIVSTERQEERIELFQKYAYLGLKEMKRVCYDEKPEIPLFGILRLLDQLDRPDKGDLPALEGLM